MSRQGCRHETSLYGRCADCGMTWAEQATAARARAAELIDYQYRCLSSAGCDPLADTHTRQCEQVNQLGREEFYLDHASAALGELIVNEVAYRVLSDRYAAAVARRMREEYGT